MLNFLGAAFKKLEVFISERQGLTLNEEDDIGVLKIPCKVSLSEN